MSTIQKSHRFLVLPDHSQNESKIAKDSIYKYETSHDKYLLQNKSITQDTTQKLYPIRSLQSSCVQDSNSTSTCDSSRTDPTERPIDSSLGSISVQTSPETSTTVGHGSNQITHISQPSVSSESKQLLVHSISMDASYRDWNTLENPRTSMQNTSTNSSIQASVRNRNTSEIRGTSMQKPSTNSSIQASTQNTSEIHGTSIGKTSEIPGANSSMIHHSSSMNKPLEYRSSNHLTHSVTTAKLPSVSQMTDQTTVSNDLPCTTKLSDDGGKGTKPVYVQQSAFLHRPATVVFEYPSYLGISLRRNDASRQDTSKMTRSNKEKEPVQDMTPIVSVSNIVPTFKISIVHEYNSVRNAFLRAGFSRTRGSKFSALWSKHHKEDELAKLNAFQKVNHFPGTWALGRKDRLARCISRMIRQFGDECEVSPRTYHLPTETQAFKRELARDSKSMWILKPVASSCGRGIRLISGTLLYGHTKPGQKQKHGKNLTKKTKTTKKTTKQTSSIVSSYSSVPNHSNIAENNSEFDTIHDTDMTPISTDSNTETETTNSKEISSCVESTQKSTQKHFGKGTLKHGLPKKNQKYVAQRYIKNPHLIQGKKYDLRIYVLVTSFDPLRVYMYKDGLVRFCTQPYSTSKKDGGLSNRFAHLTNYSVNKKSSAFDKNKDDSMDDCGSKWGLQAWLRYLDENMNINSTQVMTKIHDLVIKTLLSCEPDVSSACGRAFRARNANYGTGTPCFEVFGFDVLMDELLRPWLMEVNVSPSLSSSSPLDKKIKCMLMTDVFHLVGFVPYNKDTIHQLDQQTHLDQISNPIQQKIKQSNRSTVRAQTVNGLNSSLNKNVESRMYPDITQRDIHSRTTSVASRTNISSKTKLNNRPNTASTLSSNVLKSRKTPTDLLSNSYSLADLSDMELCHIWEFEDEYQRKGNFDLIFPTADTSVMYTKYFESQKHANTVLRLWLTTWRPNLQMALSNCIETDTKLNIERLPKMLRLELQAFNAVNPVYTVLKCSPIKSNKIVSQINLNKVKSMLMTNQHHASTKLQRSKRSSELYTSTFESKKNSKATVSNSTHANETLANNSASTHANETKSKNSASTHANEIKPNNSASTHSNEIKSNNSASTHANEIKSNNSASTYANETLSNHSCIESTRPYNVSNSITRSTTSTLQQSHQMPKVYSPRNFKMHRGLYQTRETLSSQIHVPSNQTTIQSSQTLSHTTSTIIPSINRSKHTLRLSAHGNNTDSMRSTTEHATEHTDVKRLIRDLSRSYNLGI